MINYRTQALAQLLLLWSETVSVFPARAAPSLEPGVWTRISPPSVVMTAANHVFCQGMAIDPSHSATIYLCVCAYDVSLGGLYKTTDRGATWRKIGKLDEPIHIVIDPKESKHLCCVDGVRGETQGFWVSRDGGDGVNLYTGCSNENEPIFVSPESDDPNWKPYTFNGATQKFTSEPFEMAHDRRNHIMYAASWHEGLLALRMPRSLLR